MNETDEILIRLLASTDALWRPMRAHDWAGSMPTVLLEHRRLFPTVGVPWHGSSPTEAGRKRTQRALEACAKDGLLAIHGKIRRNTAKLHDTGELRARALCGLPGLTDAMALLREVQAQPVTMPSELALVGLETYQDEPDAGVRGLLAELAFRAAPALCREWLEARSDLHGRVYYSLTPSGEQAIVSLPAIPDGLPRQQQACWDLYAQQFGESLARLRAEEPETVGEIGFIPLSVALNGHYEPRAALKVATLV